jgi:hypothetical protein
MTRPGRDLGTLAVALIACATSYLVTSALRADHPRKPRRKAIAQVAMPAPCVSTAGDLGVYQDANNNGEIVAVFDAVCTGGHAPGCGVLYSSVLFIWVDGEWQQAAGTCGSYYFECGTGGKQPIRQTNLNNLPPGSSLLFAAWASDGTDCDNPGELLDFVMQYFDH